MGRVILFLCFCACSPVVLHAQGDVGMIRGRLVQRVSKAPLQDVQIQIPLLRRNQQTDGAGAFVFGELPFGDYVLVVGSTGSRRDSIRVTLNQPELDLGEVAVSNTGSGSDVTAQNLQIPTIALEDNDADRNGDDGMQGQSVSSLLVASQDPFLNTAAFVFGLYRFQPRGYQRSMQQVFINDVPVNDVETGDAAWNQWGGLNDVFRARSQTYGLALSSGAYGGIGGSIMFDATAASQYKQTRITYSISNRQYRNRLMVTHNSGMMKGGWAYSFSASRRWGQEGFVAGTFYNGYSYYAGVSRVIKKHQFSLTTFGAPTQRGKSAPATQEVYDLAGSNFYNPNWGYQNGEKRNARVADVFQPVFILNHQYAPNERFRVYTAAAYQFGKNGNSSLDWYNAKDPRPDYYRYLPSWQILNFQDPAAAEDIKNKWRADPGKYAQIDWDRIYQVNYANRETISNVNGIAGNDVTGRRSVYVVSEDVDCIRKYTFNTHLEKKVGDRFTVFAGLSYIKQQTESYKELQDLLGGDFYLNLNQFAVQQNVPEVSFNQYDLNNPNRLIRVGDKYNYHYLTNFDKGWIWAQGLYTTRRVDMFVAVNAGTDKFSREGKFRNGLFADASFGKSEAYLFPTYGVKGGATLKLNGRNYLFVHAGLMTDAPTIENTFVSIRTRNIALDNPKVQQSKSIEGGYLLRRPGYNVRLSGYATEVTDAAQIKRFFNDDPAYQTFVNYVLEDIRMRFVGSEIGVDARLTTSLSVNFTAALGQAFYTSNPKVSVFRDNDTVRTAAPRSVYIRNYYVAAGPQSAYSLGWTYQAPKAWVINLRCNYFDRNYIDVNPDRRTEEAGDLIPRSSEKYVQIFGQEKLPSVFTMDLSFRKSIPLYKIVRKLSRNTSLYLNAGVNNLLNNTNIRTGGFEQLRYDFSENNPQKFPPKYFYGFGANYFVNISLKF